MSKKTHLAAQTSHGISEAISLAYINGKNIKFWKQDVWEKNCKRADGVGITFEEVTDTQMKKGIDKYGKWYDKQMKQIAADIAKANKPKKNKKPDKESKK